VGGGFFLASGADAGVTCLGLEV
ncbi:uncharacterized protein METZ01_LOCUS291135, partial [marine metagenome]